MKPISNLYTIETSLYLLRAPQAGDIPFIYSASQHKGFTDGMIWDPPENEEELIKSLTNSLKGWQEGNAYSFTILEKHSNTFLGRISIRLIDDKDVWNVGFWTHPIHQNKGIMTEVLQAILHFGFQELKAERIEACYALWNIASEKVLKRNGMQFDRYLEKGFKKNGKWVDENLLAITNEEWQKGLK
jgi:ribosomal-protein-alanine N-acetyltransferase